MESMYWLRRMCATRFSVLHQLFTQKTDLHQKYICFYLFGGVSVPIWLHFCTCCASEIGSLHRINRYFTAWIPHWPTFKDFKVGFKDFRIISRVQEPDFRIRCYRIHLSKKSSSLDFLSFSRYLD